MRILTCVVAATIIAFLGAGNALADAEPGQGYFSVMGSYVDDDDDRGVEDDFNGGQLGFGYAINDEYNIEAIFRSIGPMAILAAGPTTNIWASASTCSVCSAAPNASARTCMLESGSCTRIPPVGLIPMVPCTQAAWVS